MYASSVDLFLTSLQRLFGETVHLEVDFRDLKIGSILGRGACSSVYAASHKRSGERYALKIFNVYDRGQASQLHNEILLLTSFQCDALISLKGAFHDHGSIGVILEFMDRGTIEFMKDPDVRVSDMAMAAMSFQVVWGLAFLHYERQLHRDIKPGNILMVRPRFFLFNIGNRFKCFISHLLV